MAIPNMPPRQPEGDPRTRWQMQYGYADPTAQIQRSQESLAGAFNTAAGATSGLSPAARASLQAKLAVDQAGARAGAVRDAYDDANRQNMQYDIGRRGQDIQRDELALAGELGRGRLGLDTELGRGRLSLDERLGLGNLALGQGRLGLEGELGRGDLALRGELGRGGLDISRGDLALRGELGRGGLDVERGRLGQGQQQIDLNRLLGLGGQDIQRQELAQRGEQFGQELAQRESQFGRQFGESQREREQRGQLAERGFGVQERGLGIQERGQELDFAQNFLALLQQGNIAEANQEVTRRGQDISVQLREMDQYLGLQNIQAGLYGSELQAAVQRYAAELDQVRAFAQIVQNYSLGVPGQQQANIGLLGALGQTAMV